MKSYTVYILQCFDGSYYVGVTSDIDKRLWQHDTAAFPDCYTASRRPLKLAWSHSCEDVQAAIAFEKQLKRWSHRKKSAFLRSDLPMVRRLAMNAEGRDGGDGSSGSP